MTKKKFIAPKTVLNEVGGAVKLEDILKKGAKLKVKKISKKQIEEAIKMIEKETTKTRPLTWKELHTPMTI